MLAIMAFRPKCLLYLCHAGAPPYPTGRGTWTCDGWEDGQPWVSQRLLSALDLSPQPDQREERPGESGRKWEKTGKYPRLPPGHSQDGRAILRIHGRNLGVWRATRVKSGNEMLSH